MLFFLLALLEPGSALLILQHGKPVELRTNGAADITTGRKITGKTNFRLASLTKQFTATAILLLVKDGKLSIDDPAKQHLPGWPAYADAVTIRHLLTHSSGLADYDNVPDDIPQLHDRDVLLSIQKQSKLNFDPSSQFHYSNTGYALLALIVEHKSGQRFADFLRNRIFRPLKMTGTVAYENGLSPVKNRAYGHSRKKDGPWRQDDQSSTSAVLGDGGIYSSVTDLAKWLRAIDRCTLLDCATLTSTWTSATLSKGQKTNYGFGWRTETRNGRVEISHTGSTRGFRNAIVRYPETDIAVILLTNRNEGEPIEQARAVASPRK